MSHFEGREDVRSPEDAGESRPWTKIGWEQFVEVNQNLTGIEQALALRYSSINCEWSDEELYICVSSRSLYEVRGVIRSSDEGKVDFKQLPGKVATLMTRLAIFVGSFALLYANEVVSWMVLAIWGFFAIKLVWNHFLPPSFELNVMNCLFSGPIDLMKPFDVNNLEDNFSKGATTLEKTAVKFNRHWQRNWLLWMLLILNLGLLMGALIAYS